MAKKAAAATHRVHVYYSGRVQGVGFRHCAEEVAHRVGAVHGFVKNMSDGRVEVVCEGSKDRIEAFLDQVQTCPVGRFVQKVDCRWEEPTGTFTDFTVEFNY